MLLRTMEQTNSLVAVLEEENWRDLIDLTQLADGTLNMYCFDGDDTSASYHCLILTDGTVRDTN